MRIKRSDREANHSPPSSVHVVVFKRYDNLPSTITHCVGQLYFADQATSLIHPAALHIAGITRNGFINSKMKHTT